MRGDRSIVGGVAVNAEGGVWVEGGGEAGGVAHAHLKFCRRRGGYGAAVGGEEGGVSEGSGVSVGEEDVAVQEVVGGEGCDWRG